MRKSRCKLKSRIHEIIALFLVLHATSSACLACGPTLPNTFLDGGDNAILAPPVLNFESELKRMNLAPRAFAANPPTNGEYAEQSLEADLADLRAALIAASISEDQQNAII